MSVEHQRGDAGEDRVLAVQVPPTGLDHRDPGVVEVRDDLAEEVGRRDEVRVEEGEQLALRDLEARRERARLVAHAVVAVHVRHVDARIAQLLDALARDVARLVGRVVEHLDLEAVTRVLDARYGGEQAAHDGGLVEDRQLDGDGRKPTAGQVGRDGARRQLRDALLEHCHARSQPRRRQNQVRAVNAVDREDSEDERVKQADRKAHGGRADHIRPGEMSRTCISLSRRVRAGRPSPSALSGRPRASWLWRRAGRWAASCRRGGGR